MRIFHPLRSLPVALLWGGLSLSALGDQLYAVALSWIAVDLLGSEAGYLAALQALVTLLAVLGIGRWADRWEQRRIMVGADLARAVALLAAVGLWMLNGRPGAPQLFGAILILAVGQALFQPALQPVLRSLVSDARLLPATNGLLDATDRSARLLGPGLVALFAGVVPVAHFLTIDAVSFLLSAGALLLIIRLCPEHSGMRVAGHETIWHAIVRGCRAMAGHKLLGYTLATGGLLNGTWYAVFFLGLPLMIAGHAGDMGNAAGPGGTGLGWYGLVLSAYGCSNLAATLYFGGRTMTRRPQWQMFGGNLVVGFGVVLLGVAGLLPPRWMLPGFLAASAIGAIGGPMKDIPLAVLRQTRLRPSDMAAAMRAYMAASNAGILLAMLLTPTAVAQVGTVAAVVVCGLTSIAVGLVGIGLHAGWVEGPIDPEA